MASHPLNDPVWTTPRPAPRTAAFEPDERVDVAIVGGGFQGLSTALHAARLGLSVRLLEAGAIGSGASGLNGGQVIPGLKYDPDWLIEHFGPARGEALVSFAAATADAVFDLITKERLDVPFVRSGWIQAAHTQTAMQAAEKRHAQWAARGADATLLDAATIARLTGARGYVGGWLDSRAGVIHPLAFAHDLARLATAAGARLTANCRVKGLRQRGGRWIVETQEGRMEATKVVVATNAYSGALVPGLSQSIVPLHSFQIATARLPEKTLARILPGGQAVSGSRRILVYYRRSHDGRLMLGGRGRMGRPRADTDWAHIERALLRLYPRIEGVPIEKRWFGRVCVTPDHLPHLHEPSPGLIAAVGCQGRGVGLMTALGQRIAAYLASGDRYDLPFPVTPVAPIPLHRFRQVGVAAAIAWYRMLDGLER